MYIIFPDNNHITLTSLNRLQTATINVSSTNNLCTITLLAQINQMTSYKCSQVINRDNDRDERKWLCKSNKSKQHRYKKSNKAINTKQYYTHIW